MEQSVTECAEVVKEVAQRKTQQVQQQVTHPVLKGLSMFQVRFLPDLFMLNNLVSLFRSSVSNLGSCSAGGASGEYEELVLRCPGRHRAETVLPCSRPARA